MTASILGAIASLIIFIFVFDLLRRGVLKEKYAVLWLFVAGIGLVFSIIPGALDWLGSTLGVGAPVNLLFFVMGVVLGPVARLQGDGGADRYRRDRQGH